MSGQWHRVLIYNLPVRFNEDDIRDLLSDYKTIQRVDCKVKYGYVFFTDSKDAEDAIEKLDGKVVDGKEIHIELANNKEAKNNDPPNYGLRVRVYGLSYRTTWQDLKDWARIAGKTKYANVTERGSQKIGVVEFLDFETYDKAFEILENYPLNRENVRLAKEEEEHRKDQESGVFRSNRRDDSRRSPGRNADRDRDYRGGSNRGYEAPYSRGNGGYDSRDSRSYDNRDSRPYDRDARESRGYSDDYRKPVGNNDSYYRDERPRSRSRSRERSATTAPPPRDFGFNDRDSRAGDRYGGSSASATGRGGGYNNYGRR
eukprot:gene18666-24412_t